MSSQENISCSPSNGENMNDKDKLSCLASKVMSKTMDAYKNDPKGTSARKNPGSSLVGVAASIAGCDKSSSSSSHGHSHNNHPKKHHSSKHSGKHSSHGNHHSDHHSSSKHSKQSNDIAGNIAGA